MCQDTVDVTVIKAEWFLTLHTVYSNRRDACLESQQVRYLCIFGTDIINF